MTQLAYDRRQCEIHRLEVLLIVLLTVLLRLVVGPNGTFSFDFSQICRTRSAAISDYGQNCSEVLTASCDLLRWISLKYFADGLIHQLHILVGIGLIQRPFSYPTPH